MKFGLDQKLSSETKLEQSAPFLESCLPKTMLMAKRHKVRILPQLDKTTASFPYGDRLLMWLDSASYWKEDIERFHRSGGKNMAEMFCSTPHKFQRFDDFYSEELANRLREDIAVKAVQHAAAAGR